MSSLRAYRGLPGAAGWWFLVVGLLGRLPAAMLQIGALLLVSDSTGSLASGGAAAAALALGQALGGPLVGRLADSHGHRVVGLVTATVQSVAIVVLVVLATRPATLPVVLLAAFLVGVMVPQVGPLVRARWAGVVNDRAVPSGTFGTAMSYEGAADETTFVLGPALVGLVVAAWSPSAAMLLAAVLTAVFATAFALHPTAGLVGHHETVQDVVPRRSDLRSLWLLTGLMFCIGLFFASVQAGVTSIAIAAGSEGSAGLVYGAMGITSAIAGLLTAALPARFTYPTRLVVFPAVLLLCVVPLVLIGVGGSTSLGWLTGAVVLAGAAVAPTLITGFYLGERAVPLSRVSWAMTVMASGVVLGYAAAALLAGVLAEAHGSIGAFAVTFGAVVVAVALAAAGHRRYTRLLAVTAEPATAL